jgi:endonuclease YncB( thermonuclease family)
MAVKIHVGVVDGDTLEKLARSTRKGLWKDKQPQAPWDYRHQNP